jgi:hypothetical protein
LRLLQRSLAERPPLSALAQARRFLAALIRSMHEPGARALDARREMRALAPQLLAAYLERRGAARTPLNGQG